MEQEEILTLLHHPNISPPAIQSCDTPNTSDTKSHWTAEELHRITGCRCFRNYKHLISTTKDGSFIDNGKFPLSIGAFTTIPKAPHGKAIDRTTSKFLDIVHLDIAFGDCMSVGGFKYALIFVDRATRFNWCFGLKSLHHNDIIAAFMAFHSDAGSLARHFQCDCDEKLFGSHVRSFLHLDHSSIASSPAGRQSTNGLVESYWKIMVHMSRAYLTEKQMPCSFWYYAIKHSAQMMNMIPGRYGGKLASPFLLVHGVRPDQRTWLALFSICYFHHEKDSDVQRSKNQAHTMDGIVIGRSPTSNAIVVYTPGINVTTNTTATNSTHIGYLYLFILLLFMTVAYLLPSVVTTLPPLANLTLRVCEWLNPVLATMQSYGLALPWIFPWTRPHLHNMSSSLMTAPLNQCRHPKWPLPSPSQPSPPLIHPTFSQRSFD
jgi:hypothetical protein